MDELIQIVDDNDEPIRGAKHSEALKSGLRYRVVHVLVWNQAGELLVQLRGEKAEEFSGSWGASVSGYMYEQERYDVAAARKLADELGLSNVELRDIATFNSDDTTDKYDIKRVNKVFETEVQSDAELRIDPGQIADIKWLSAAELKLFTQDAQNQIAPGLRRIVEQLL